MKYLYCLLIGIILFVLFFCGCTSEEEEVGNEFLGTWNDIDTSYGSITFYEDGTCNVNGNVEATYRFEGVDDEHILINYNHNDKTYTYEYQFSYQGKRLTLREVRDGYVHIYDKQT